jgi:stringent starvation protein B
MDMPLTPTKPYLIRAFYEWIVDNDLTPHILVNAETEGVAVPSEFISDGQIILNISPGAIKMMDMANDWIYFNARFGGVSQDIHVPVHAVKAIYAQENGKGMVFAEEDIPPPPVPEDKSDKGKSTKKPSLRIVK